eukprot:2193341-Rhodomonas_salina.1
MSGTDMAHRQLTLKQYKAVENKILVGPPSHTPSQYWTEQCVSIALHTCRSTASLSAEASANMIPGILEAMADVLYLPTPPLWAYLPAMPCPLWAYAPVMYLRPYYVPSVLRICYAMPATCLRPRLMAGSNGFFLTSGGDRPKSMPSWASCPSTYPLCADGLLAPGRTSQCPPFLSLSLPLPSSPFLFLPLSFSLLLSLGCAPDLVRFWTGLNRYRSMQRQYIVTLKDNQ